MNEKNLLALAIAAGLAGPANAAVDGSFGQVLIGKDSGLYSRNNIFLDEILLGFGSPGAPGGVSFGNSRTGYAYPTPSPVTV